MGSHFPSSNYSSSDAQSTALKPKLHTLSCLFVYVAMLHSSYGFWTTHLGSINKPPQSIRGFYQQMFAPLMLMGVVTALCMLHCCLLFRMKRNYSIPCDMLFPGRLKIKKQKKLGKKPKKLGKIYMAPKTSLWIDLLWHHLPGEITQPRKWLH